VISACNYFDLREAAEEAAERGVKIDVYANSPDRGGIICIYNSQWIDH